MDITNGNNANRDGYDMNNMNETGGVGNANQNGTEMPNNDVDVESVGDTQLVDDPNIKNDEDEAGSLSSETADMSGESNRASSGGYSGDYSSISDSSSDRNRRNEKKTRNIHRSDDGHHKHHSKGHSHTERRRRSSADVEGSAQKMDDPRSKDEAGIHSYHRNHHHHHTSRGKAKPQDMNKQIDQIMNLYNVSLQASKVRDSDSKSINENNKASQDTIVNRNAVQVEASVTNHPQIGGLRIRDPYDPRINIEELYKSFQAAANANGVISTEQQRANKGKRPSALLEAPEEDETSNSAGQQAQQGQCYSNLIEACRPFFDSHEVADLMSPQPSLHHTNNTNQEMETNTAAAVAAAAQAADYQSSSGFTSFFTTTAKSESTTETNQIHSSKKRIENASDFSDSSSLVVLARVKRKYNKEQQLQSRQGTSSSNSDDSKKRRSEESTETTTKRVRIDTVAIKRQVEPLKAQESQTSSLTQSLESSGSDSLLQQTKKKEEDSSTKARLVTDSRSTNNTSTSKSESGGSGNGDTNSDEQKVLPGDSDRPPSSDVNNQDTKVPIESQPVAVAYVKTDKPHIHHHHAGGHQEEENRKSPTEGVLKADHHEPVVTNATQQGGDIDAVVSKEKILEKKRKRMNMRREYEEEVCQMMRDSSSSISPPQDPALQPGKPLTLEEVLYFTKTARLLVQAIPPFLAVHTNAAFTHLCGIQSSVAIGTPVSSIISLPDAHKESDSGSDNNNKDTMSSLSGNSQNENDRNSDAAIDNSSATETQREGEGQGQQAADNNQIPSGNTENETALRIDRLIVARGYGHIHEVNVVRMPHLPRHKIEGSEVKFIDGAPAKRRKTNNSKILCRMSVSPVISSTTPADHHHHGHTDTNNKRRKTRLAPNETITVKHYLIQLEEVEGPCTLMSGSSCASADTIFEAKIKGITKAEVHARRCGLKNQEEGGNDQARAVNTDSQDSTSGMDPVATCG